MVVPEMVEEEKYNIQVVKWDTTDVNMRSCIVLCILLLILGHTLVGSDTISPNEDIISVIRKIQKDFRQFTEYVHQRDNKVDKKIEAIEKNIQDLKEESRLSRTFITSDDVIFATSSSVWFNAPESYGPQFAWKGRSTVSGGGFFHSAAETNPWLLIQIPRVQLFSVTIINRKDCCGQELRNVQVRAGLSRGLGNEVVGMFQGPGETGKEYIIGFNKGIVVEWISFQKIETGRLMINGIKVNEVV